MSFVRAAARWGCCTAAVASLALPAYSADKKAKDVVAETPSYYGPQPATENIDLTMYARIREEGLKHSHVMEFGGALADGIGPRLTGSPNMAKANAWTRDTLTKIGLENAHLEDWGEFGMGLAADQHMGPNGLTRSRTPLGAGFPMVARNQRPSLRRSRLHERAGDGRISKSTRAH